MIPFLKWAGGKRWFASKYAHQIATPLGRYIEPFVGSGALYFHLEPNSALIADANRDLIETYKAIRDDPQAVQKELTRHASLHSNNYYYECRKYVPSCKYERAGRFIYLNRTCWNGLYRVNKNGEFNVPRGTKNSVLFSTDDFEKWSQLLKNTVIKSQDFEETISEAEEGDLVFADPPYTVKHNLNGFVKYNEILFSWDDQQRLMTTLHSASKRGVQVILLNADHDSIRNLYGDHFDMMPLDRYSVLASDKVKRKKITELLIRS